MEKQKASHKLFHRYEYLAEIYANKLWDIGNLGLEREDIVQELKLKIFTAIRSYARRWKEWRKTGLYKPIPLVYYLQTSLNNKLKDLMGEISKESNKISIQRNECDFGFNGNGELTKIDFENKEIVVRGVDFLEGLDRFGKSAFSLYLKGYPMKIINQVYKHKIEDPSALIRGQVDKLVEQEESLLDRSSDMSFSYTVGEN